MLGIFVHILIWCKLKLAHVLLYYELIFLIVIQGFVPYNYGEMAHYTALCTIIVVYIVTVCSPS